MVLFTDGLEQVNKYIEKTLPEIEGVEFVTDFSKNCMDRNNTFSLMVRMDIDGSDPRHIQIREILNRLHKVLCGGQVKLELER